MVTKSQKKIIYHGLIITFVFLILWLFIYIPMDKRLKVMKSEIVSIENEISSIEQMIGVKTIKADTIKQLQSRYKKLLGKFPAKEEESLKMLSDLAKRENILIVSIKPKVKQVCVNSQNQPLVVEEMRCQRVYVDMIFDASYIELLRYIESLGDDFPAFVTIEKCDVAKHTASMGKSLRINLEFYLYLLS